MELPPLNRTRGGLRLDRPGDQFNPAILIDIMPVLMHGTSSGIIHRPTPPILQIT